MAANKWGESFARWRGARATGQERAKSDLVAPVARAVVNLKTKGAKSND